MKIWKVWKENKKIQRFSNGCLWFHLSILNNVFQSKCVIFSSRPSQKYKTFFTLAAPSGSARNDTLLLHTHLREAKKHKHKKNHLNLIQQCTWNIKKDYLKFWLISRLLPVNSVWEKSVLDLSLLVTQSDNQIIWDKYSKLKRRKILWTKLSILFLVSGYFFPDTKAKKMRLKGRVSFFSCCHSVDFRVVHCGHFKLTSVTLLKENTSWHPWFFIDF